MPPWPEGIQRVGAKRRPARRLRADCREEMAMLSRALGIRLRIACDQRPCSSAASAGSVAASRASGLAPIPDSSRASSRSGQRAPALDIEPAHGARSAFRDGPCAATAPCASRADRALETPRSARSREGETAEILEIHELCERRIRTTELFERIAEARQRFIFWCVIRNLRAQLRQVRNAPAASARRSRT